jgi:ADP-ribose pyrophosphatase YjhB (NUDIX family)
MLSGHESIAQRPSRTQRVMTPSEHFLYCPQCGRSRSGHPPTNPFQCEACGFVFYFNPAIAVAALVLNDDGRALFIRRAKEPAQGKLALPGGFVDFEETAEDALRREVMEEVGIQLARVVFLCSHPNHYWYKGIQYLVLDLFFVAWVRAGCQAQPLDAVASLSWLDPMRVEAQELAFPSMQHALSLFQRESPLRRSPDDDLSRNTAA